MSLTYLYSGGSIVIYAGLGLRGHTLVMPGQHAQAGVDPGRPAGWGDRFHIYNAPTALLHINLEVDLIAK